MTTTKTFTYSHTIGFLTAVGRGFTNPVDLAFNSQGVIYVLNRAGPETTVRLPSKRVSMCTIDEEFLGEWGTGGQIGRASGREGVESVVVAGSLKRQQNIEHDHCTSVLGGSVR